MLAAMTTKGVIAGQHRNIVNYEWFQLVPQSYRENPGN
jgi:hypothetical protein